MAELKSGRMVRGRGVASSRASERASRSPMASAPSVGATCDSITCLLRTMPTKFNPVTISPPGWDAGRNLSSQVFRIEALEVLAWFHKKPQRIGLKSSSFSSPNSTALFSKLLKLFNSD